MSQGALYVAVGRKAGFEARISIESLRMHSRLKVMVAGDQKIDGALFHPFENVGRPGRWAKVNLDKISPWDDTLFLDADTRIRKDVSLGFRLLDYGWDMVMVGSIPQGEDVLNHATSAEREITLMEIPLDPFQFNTGVMWFRKTTRVRRFFVAWRKEWQRWQDVDQGAFLRALNRRPIAIALLGRDYNGGRVIEHRFGACG